MKDHDPTWHSTGLIEVGCYTSIGQVPVNVFRGATNSDCIIVFKDSGKLFLYLNFLLLFCNLSKVNSQKHKSHYIFKKVTKEKNKIATLYWICQKIVNCGTCVYIFCRECLFGSPGSRLVSQLPLPYIGIAKYSDKCDSVITAEIKLENC